MHPLLVGRLRMSLYLALWAGVSFVLAEFLALLGSRPLPQTLVFVAPLCFVYAFVCLAAWWVCRSHPLLSTPPMRLTLALGGATLQASALWVVAGAAWGILLSRASRTPATQPELVRDLAVL